MENSKQKVYWCQCLEIQKQVAEKMKGKIISEKDTGEVCHKCGYKIFETVVDKKEYCEELYRLYKELREKTELEVHDLKPGGEIHPKYIDIKEVEERIKVKEELYKCLDFLSDQQLIELSGNYDFIKEAGDILMKRKRQNLSQIL